MASTNSNPYEKILETLEIGGEKISYFNLPKLNDDRYAKLPFSIRVLLESAVRTCDNFTVKPEDIEKILDWNVQQYKQVEVPFRPSRVLLQDLTGVAAVVDFAAMRDAFKRLGGDPIKINPLCPADLVIDHSVQVDFSRIKTTILNNSTNHTTELCSDCKASGQCQYEALARSMAGNGQASNSNNKSHTHNHNNKASNNATNKYNNLKPNVKANLQTVPDIENLVITPKIMSTSGSGSSQTLINDFSPHPDLKLRHRDCPFHRQQSLGATSLQRNEELEFERNRERFEFLKWGANSLKNMTIIPPGSGICHQVNLEYLARMVFKHEGYLYPDSLVGIDSHTTMINGLGIVGWGCGGLELLSAALGQPICMVLPEVIGYRLEGKLPQYATSTDVVLTITKHLRQLGVVGKFVEFFGPGVSELSIADRATIANMCPEYGATIAFFPPDSKAIEYLVQTDRNSEQIQYTEQYLRAVQMFRIDYLNAAEDPTYTQVVSLDLATIKPSLSGPKRPQDRVPVDEMKTDFRQCLTSPVGFKGYGLSSENLEKTVDFEYDGKKYTLRNGSVVISAITSCTNTSNPSVMLGAGLLAKKAVEKGLSVAPYIKTSMSPGSGVVTYYLKESGVAPFLQQLGFDIVGYGCMTCIGNSGPLPQEVVEAIEKGDLVACGILSGNRNFEGRVHPNTRANYLASPLLVVAAAIAGRIDIDFETEPIGQGTDGKAVFLRDIWPSRDEILEVQQRCVIPAMFKDVYSKIKTGNDRWNDLKANEDLLYNFNPSSTYIKNPPYFEGMTTKLPEIKPIVGAKVLLYFGDSVTTDHISPAGSIARNSPAARYLTERGVAPAQFNSYGSRRGNDSIMTRGTFANIRLVNKLMSKPGPMTLGPQGQELSVFDAAEAFKADGTPLIILAGKDYGCGSSRDWAAKGPMLLGVRAIIAEGYERIHRSNLIGMGIMPLQFLAGETAESLGLTGKEIFSIDIPDVLTPRMNTKVQTSDGKSFEVTMRFDTEVEIEYFKNGGILHYMLRELLKR